MTSTTDAATAAAAAAAAAAAEAMACCVAAEPPIEPSASLVGGDLRLEDMALDWHGGEERTGEMRRTGGKVGRESVRVSEIEMWRGGGPLSLYFIIILGLVSEIRSVASK